MYNLLIVDDNYVQIQSVLNYIDWRKFNIDIIETAQNGEEGLEMFKKINPDIVITDVVMPIMDGVEMTKQALLLNPRAKFIYMSCYDDFGYLKSAMDNGVISYILKPIDPKELKESVIKLIREIVNEKKYKTMHKMFEEGIDEFRENFLYRFLYSRHFDDNYLKNSMRNLGFEEFNYFLAAKIAVSADDPLCTSYNVLELTRKLVINSLKYYVIIESETCCVIMFMGNEATKEVFLNTVQNELSQFCEAAKNDYDMILNIGISLVNTTLYDAQFLLNQASCALENSLISNCEGIYVYEDFQYAQMEFDILTLKDALTALIDNSSPHQINIFMEKYYPENAYYKKNYVKTLCIFVITTLQFILLERNLDIKDLFGNSYIVWDKLDKFDTIKDTRQWLYNMLCSTLQFISENEKNKYEKIVNDIINNIDENYSQISNIEQITDTLYISISYAKSIFKKYTGKTIFDYLLSKRMEAAKQLLSNPYAKVYEVADAVGYKSKAHFSETFRRYTGLTPKDFQNKH